MPRTTAVPTPIRRTVTPNQVHQGAAANCQSGVDAIRAPSFHIYYRYFPEKRSRYKYVSVHSALRDTSREWTAQIRTVAPSPPRPLRRGSRPSECGCTLQPPSSRPGDTYDLPLRIAERGNGIKWLSLKLCVDYTLFKAHLGKRPQRVQYVVSRTRHQTLEHALYCIAPNFTDFTGCASAPHPSVVLGPARRSMGWKTQDVIVSCVGHHQNTTSDTVQQQLRQASSSCIVQMSWSIDWKLRPLLPTGTKTLLLSPDLLTLFQMQAADLLHSSRNGTAFTVVYGIVASFDISDPYWPGMSWQLNRRLALSYFRLAVPLPVERLPDSPPPKPPLLRCLLVMSDPPDVGFAISRPPSPHSHARSHPHLKYSAVKQRLAAFAARASHPEPVPIHALPGIEKSRDSIANSHFNRVSAPDAHRMAASRSPATGDPSILSLFAVMIAGSRSLNTEGSPACGFSPSRKSSAATIRLPASESTAQHASGLGLLLHHDLSSRHSQSLPIPETRRLIDRSIAFVGLNRAGFSLSSAPPRMDVQLILGHLGIACYWAPLCEAGFESWEVLQDITEADINCRGRSPRREESRQTRPWNHPCLAAAAAAAAVLLPGRVRATAL
ncbi:hypothetical protein MBM_01625 [Drepanopeziza brunnea f. sp. 'multigermtubi' MB_m1]|uniref:Uncharacterized protein n=1 Tax=Marssonina brunnea f. sp. multigermtubi (strain MB_m1) TaxID=1072389 RepID=K1XFW3_MARBU|nr:uncharacterized protein MBM_01625 [Drepanopeziza brunnea f. sp. 'multigermtubi' MB_m1]EKD19673.1 hypothetical protein MBM_01625 [Drepanopeziza brunnea f. sp. 'multigermtubi' MB_m1]